MNINKNYKAILCALMLTTSLVTVTTPVSAEEVNDVEAPADVVASPDAAKTAEATNPVSAYVSKPIMNISVAGNKITKQDDILAVTKTKAGDSLTEAAIKQDLQSIYEMGNFFDIIVNFQEIPEGVNVVYTVIENPILKDIVVKGNTKVDTNKILEMLTIKKGEILNTKTLNANARSIEAYYHDKGFIFTKVSDVAMSNDGVLTLSVNEGVLEGFQVKGNTKTKDYVVTREMRLKPGEAFNVKAARRSMQRVYNLGYFEDVNMKLNPGREPNAVVLETDVVEKRTGSFSVGAGYSSSDGLIGIFEIGDTNFRGTGDAIKIHFEFGGDADTYDSYQFSYTKPWLDSKQTSATFRVYDMTHEYDNNDRDGHLIETYDKKYKGYELSFGRPVSEYSTNYITFKDRKDEYIKHVDGTTNYGDGTHAQYLKDNFGDTRSVILAHTTDTRDNIYNPTEGAKVTVSGEFAGIAGGDFDYNKYSFEDHHYFKVGRNHVIATRATVGYATGSMPEAALFDAGGQTTLRGYKDDQFQGKNLLLGSVEYRFPIVNKVQGALFTDFGNAWDGNYSVSGLHTSIGVGIQMETPIGPIRLDYGKGEDGGRTHFSFGGSF
ncbi:MAG: surface antigen [Massilibacillus sp.]|jgi:outer membrane protein insertion porin family|nr:surface antigen [Massilibacillus sp.]